MLSEKCKFQRMRYDSLTVKVYKIWEPPSQVYSILIKLEDVNLKWLVVFKIENSNLTKSAGNCGFGHIHWRNP